MQNYRPSQLIQLLKELDLQPKKSLSQNFLIDGNIVNNIIKAAHIKAGDKILEIGPGPGTLTFALLKTSLPKFPTQVIAVEKDAAFADYLKSFHLPNLYVQNQDFLKTNLKNLLQIFRSQTFQEKTAEKKTRTNLKKFKLVANLPYHITTPILVKILENFEAFRSLTIMLQKELAQRITASVRTKAYGALTLFIRTYADPEIAFFVSHNCFYPKPDVDSAVLNLNLKKPPLPKSKLKKWHSFVQSTFQKRRKKISTSIADFCLKDSLQQNLKTDSKIHPKTKYKNIVRQKKLQKEKKSIKEHIEKLLLKLNLNLNSRPEELSFANFLQIFQNLF